MLAEKFIVNKQIYHDHMNTEASVKFSQAFHRYILIVHQNYFSSVKGGFLPLRKFYKI